MAEESAVNYWEVRPPLSYHSLWYHFNIPSPQKYGNVAFDSTQKAVLTSCVLRFKPNIAAPSGSVTPAIRRTANTAPISSSLPLAVTANAASNNGVANGAGEAGGKGGANAANEEGFINCCFSFTIRRDTWGIPSMIVGNFIRC